MTRENYESRMNELIRRRDNALRYHCPRTAAARQRDIDKLQAEYERYGI